MGQFGQRHVDQRGGDGDGQADDHRASRDLPALHCLLVGALTESTACAQHALAAVNRVRRQWVAAANPAAPQLASGAANHGMGLPHHTVHRVSGLPAGGLYSIGPRSLLDHHDGASSGLVRTTRGALPPGKLSANGQSVWTEVSSAGSVHDGQRSCTAASPELDDAAAGGRVVGDRACTLPENLSRRALSGMVDGMHRFVALPWLIVPPA